MLLGIYGNILEWWSKHLIACPYRSLLHMDCPGCGLQRSIILLLQGNLAASLRLYPATIPILFLFIYLLVYLLFKQKRGTQYLKILFFFCSSIIVIHYIYKVINGQLF